MATTLGGTVRSLYGMVSRTASAVGDTVGMLGDGVSYANNGISNALAQQAQRHVAENHAFGHRLLAETAKELAEFDKGIREFCADADNEAQFTHHLGELSKAMQKHAKAVKAS